MAAIASSSNGSTGKSTGQRPESVVKPFSYAVPPGVEDSSSSWGEKFWVTLIDPQTATPCYACPATGQVSWDPPVGNFVLPPNADGEWWELSDESRGGLPYYYQTKTGETVWGRPEGFVIPLGIIQNTATGRTLSQSTFANGPGQPSTPSRNSPAKGSPSPASKGSRRSYSGEYHSHSRSHTHHSVLPPIPGSPEITEASAPPSPSSARGPSRGPSPSREQQDKGMNRSRSKSSTYISHRSPAPQSLNAAVELLSNESNQAAAVRTRSDVGHTSQTLLVQQRPSTSSGRTPSSPSKLQRELPPSPGRQVPPSPRKKSTNIPPVPPSPRRPVPALPSRGSFWNLKNHSTTSLGGKEISGPVLNAEATAAMSPVKNRANGKPIPVDPRIPPLPRKPTMASSVASTYPALPVDLASDIQQFSESDFARQYFSTHRTGFIFRRRVPVAQMMVWQKAPLHSPLLTVNRALHKDAVRMFKVIQHIMGDREKDRPVGGVRMASEGPSMVASINPNGSSTSLAAGTNGALLEEERWLLAEGLAHGELRDEIYCQVMKQCSNNPHPESVFKGWQLLCVLLITFPPSKNFEMSLQQFLQQHTSKQEGRVDVMAKYCLRRLSFIAKKGPRGKPPSLAEIETASDAAFNPSTFGESLDAIIRLQERQYPQQQIPIILPFLADGILALGGTKAEGIFRVPGDGDSVSELKLRIDRGYYTLDNVDDPHVLASLLKLWLRELLDPLVPEEMYNECIGSSKDPEACVRIVERLPTVNRRVVLFVISFLQLFLEERIMGVTKMTPANLALVFAPNLLRCNSESMAVVFTNASYEQVFVFNLLLHLKCHEIDETYKPKHGLGATGSARTRRK